MKQIIKILSLIFLCTFTLFCPLQSVFAEILPGGIELPFSSGDWLCYDRGDSISVCGYTGTDGKITIPSEIGGKRVTEVSAHKTDDDIYSREYTFFEAYNGSTKEVAVPEGVISIGMYAFNLSAIEKIDLPKSLISIENGAFDGCRALTSVKIPENVKIIENSAFINSGLEEVFLPEGLESIGKWAFSHAPLKEIYIPSTVNYIGEYAFQNTDLEEVTLPKGLTVVERGLFSNCLNLKKAYLSEGITVLNNDVFYACQDLEDVYFPSTLREITYIFSHNGSLERVYFAANEEESRMLLGDDIMKILADIKSSVYIDEWEFIPGGVEVNYRLVEMIYNISVPLQEPIPYPKDVTKIDKITLLLMAVTLICLILTAVFIVKLLVERKKQAIAKAKKQEEEKSEENFHPTVLGVWQCKKCGTANSPIANYCYKCGKKGENV